VQPINSGPTAAHQLCGPELGKDDELKGTHAWRTGNRQRPCDRWPIV
jgi:hypothetical protein